MIRRLVPELWLEDFSNVFMIDLSYFQHVWITLFLALQLVHIACHILLGFRRSDKQPNPYRASHIAKTVLMGQKITHSFIGV